MAIPMPMSCRLDFQKDSQMPKVTSLRFQTAIRLGFQITTHWGFLMAILTLKVIDLQILTPKVTGLHFLMVIQRPKDLNSQIPTGFR
jgi:hypothetical protein